MELFRSNTDIDNDFWQPKPLTSSLLEQIRAYVVFDDKNPALEQSKPVGAYGRTSKDLVRVSIGGCLGCRVARAPVQLLAPIQRYLFTEER